MKSNRGSLSKGIGIFVISIGVLIVIAAGIVGFLHCSVQKVDPHTGEAKDIWGIRMIQGEETPANTSFLFTAHSVIGYAIVLVTVVIAGPLFLLGARLLQHEQQEHEA